MLDLRVDSTFYDDDSPRIQITDYYLTRMTPQTLDVQVEFAYPDDITPVLTEPDLLLIKFNETNPFIDNQDFQVL